MNTPKPATALKIAGEVQMKKIQHDMTILRRTNERLLAERAELIEALRNCVRAQDSTGGPKGSLEFASTEGARALLRKLERFDEIAGRL